MTGIVLHSAVEETGSFSVEVTVPANTTTTLRLSVGDGKVLVAGLPPEQAAGVSQPRIGRGTFTCRLLAGEYAVTAPLP